MRVKKNQFHIYQWIYYCFLSFSIDYIIYYT